MNWTRSTSCHAGSCVEVAWSRSSRCAGGDCVEVKSGHGVIYVRDSKLGDDSPVQVWELYEWRDLIRCVKVGWRPDGVSELADGCVEFGLERHDDELSFDADEWAAFVKGVLNEEFEPEKLSSPAEASRGGGPVAGREVEPAEGHGFDREVATGAELHRRGTAPVAAHLAPTGSDDRYWFGTITVPPAGRGSSISEVDAIVTTGQPGPETGPPPVKPPFYGISAARRDHDPTTTASRVLPETAHTNSSAPAAEERPVTGDRSEAGTGTSPGPVPAAEPRVWMLPPDPGDEVTAVRDFEGDEWRRSGEFWMPSDESFKLYWHQLVLEFGPLTDATAAPLVPTDGAS